MSSEREALRVEFLKAAGFGDARREPMPGDASTRLYERLHAGGLQAALRAELAYIPHLTVASHRDPVAARRNAAALNTEAFAIPGRIDELEILRLDGEVVRRVATVPLASAGLFG